MSKIIEELKELSYSECYECGSRYRMDYALGCYGCEECYRIVDFETVQKNHELMFYWDKVKKYILFHKTPKKAIKIFIIKLLKDTYEEHDIEETLDTLIEKNKLFGE